MTNRFIISDTHFGHTNIIKFEPEARAFDSIEEHDQTLIDRWNAKVKRNDLVWHLGDFVYGGATIRDYMPRLNGRKWLTLGNHDKEHPSAYAKYFEQVRGPSFMQFEGRKVLFSHMPTHPEMFEFRCCLNVHGHIHSKRVQRFDPFDRWGKPVREIIDTRYMNASVEHWGLAPFAWEEVEKYLRCMLVG